MILVSGATGNIGKEIVKLLAASNQEVRALVHTPEKAGELGPGVATARGDFSDARSLDEAMQGVSAALLNGNANPDMVAQQRAFIQACKRNKVGHIVKISVQGAAADSPVQIAKWHFQIEEDLRASGLSCTILQPTFFMQNILGFATSIRATGTFAAPAGYGRVPAVDVRDIAGVAVKALTKKELHAGKTYILTSMFPLSFADMAREIWSAGQRCEYKDCTPKEAEDGMKAMGMPDWMVKDMLVLYDAIKAGLLAEVSDAVPTVAQRPARTFGEFVKDHAGLFGVPTA